MLDRSGIVRPVHGMSGNLMLGDATSTDVLSSGCGPEFCLLKTDQQLLVMQTGATPTLVRSPFPTGPAIFAFRDHTAWIYYPQDGTLTRFSDNATTNLSAPNLTGEVLSLRVTTNALEFAVRRDGTVWIERQDGALVDSLPDADGPVLLLENAILYTSSDLVRLKRTGANTIDFPVPQVQRINTLGPRYAQITTADHVYALKLDSGKGTLSQLPEPTSITRTVRRR
ncbi:MAG: hypothetical protein ABI824_03090 [Acidobacteriota bacterium]